MFVSIKCKGKNGVGVTFLDDVELMRSTQLVHYQEDMHTFPPCG